MPVPAALRVMLMATPRQAGHRAGVTNAGREIAPTAINQTPSPCFGDRTLTWCAQSVTMPNQTPLVRSQTCS